MILEPSIFIHYPIESESKSNCLPTVLIPIPHNLVSILKSMVQIHHPLKSNHLPKVLVPYDSVPIRTMYNRNLNYIILIILSQFILI